jgi:hypothetical protein
MNTQIFMASVSLFLFAVCQATASASGEVAAGGPLQVRNQFPPHLMFLTPIPARPDPLPQGGIQLDLSLDYSSVFFAEHSDRWSVLVDMEMAVVDLGLRFGLTPRLTLSIHQPAARMGDGFLDNILADYHDAFGFPNYDKETRPTDDFAYFIRKDGRDWFRSDAGSWHLMDTTLGAEWGLLGGVRHRLSLIYEVQLPTGESESGFGSGSFDHSLRLPLAWDRKKLGFFLTPGAHLPGKPDSVDAGIQTRPFGSLLTGAAYAYRANLSLFVQINGYTSPLEETGIPKLDDGSLELGLGGLYRLGPGLGLEFAFTEDLTRAAPDFNLHLRVVIRR